MLAVHLITQSKDGISSLNLARTIGVSAQAALRLKHKLQQVMKNRDYQLVLWSLLLINNLPADSADEAKKKNDKVI